jgi:hypothetical protein
LTSFGFAYPLKKSLTTTSDGESQNKQWEEKVEAELDGIQLSSSPCPDHYMTGKFTTEHYLMDVDGNYGQVKLEIHKQSAEKVSSYESEPFSLANIENSPDMITIAAITAIVATAKLRKIFTSSSQKQLVIIKERSSILQQQPSPILLPPQPQSFTPLPIPLSLVKQVPALGKFAMFDCEWHRDDLLENQHNGIAGDIYAFCLVDDHGTVEKLHIDKFTSRREFMSTILDVLGRYDTLAGYAILSVSNSLPILRL